jgi:flavin reductase (DIM6/NTAB) family NADH-FMN oxidoreductase RutF
MLFEMDRLTGAERYKLLTSSITPRPIAWITTVSTDGILNAAPFSAFNMVGHTPPMIVLGIQPRTDGGCKDTCANILATGELVVNLVTEADVEAMNSTSVEAPPEFNEVEAGSIPVIPSTHVAPPRIATSPVSFECRTFQVIRPGPQQTIVLCEVIAVHVKDAFIVDSIRVHLDTPRMRLVGRMQGPGWYARCTDLLQVRPPGPWSIESAREVSGGLPQPDSQEGS